MGVSINNAFTFFSTFSVLTCFNLTRTADRRLLVQKLSAVGINNKSNGHHMDILSDLAIKVKIAEQITHKIANIKI